MLLIEHFQEFIRYLENSNKKNIRVTLIELNWLEFREFLYEPNTNRFSISEHLQSIV